MSVNETGWEQNRRSHFDEIVETYARVRPEYPRELIEDVFKYSGAGKTALEIGAGTGIATAPFLAAGYDVTAVEIGANMTEFLNERFRGNDCFRVITSSFEESPLPENSFDLIYAASAFHWVDAKIGCPKAFGLLKDGGALALFRYNAFPAYEDELFNDIQAEYDKHFYTHFKATESRPHRKTLEEFNTPAEIYSSYRCERLENYGFKDVQMKLYYGEKMFSAEEYLMVLDTYSDMRILPEGNRTALYAGVKAAIERHGGYHKIRYDFQLYTGRKV